MFDLHTLTTFGAHLPYRGHAPAALPGDWAQTLVRTAQQALAHLPRPVAILLSGGVDSAAIAWMLGAHIDAAFVLDAGGAVEAARPVAEAIGLPLHVVEWPDVLDTSLDDVLFALKQPIHSAAPFAFLPLYRAVAAAGFRTVLTGDGADELFGGHAYHRDPGAVWRGAVATPAALWDAYRQVRALGIDSERLLLRSPTTPWTESAFATAVAATALQIGARDERLRYLDVAVRMMPQCVRLQGLLAAEAGLRYLAPFAHPDVVRTGLSAPLESARWPMGKGPLRGWLVENVDPSWDSVPKAPIRSETGRRRAEALPTRWRALLTDEVTRRHRVFDPVAVRRAVQRIDRRSPWLPREVVVVASTHALLGTPTLLAR